MAPLRGQAARRAPARPEIAEPLTRAPAAAAGFSADWLTLREAADLRARDGRLAVILHRPQAGVGREPGDGDKCQENTGPFNCTHRTGLQSEGRRDVDVSQCNDDRPSAL